MPANEDRLALSALTETESVDVERYLRKIYEGVFSEDAIDNHLESHVGLAFADYTIQVLRPHMATGSRLLDVGCGFGSCVIAALEEGYEATGVDLATFDIEIAQKRLKRSYPELESVDIFRAQDARSLEVKDDTFDAITLWNVIEHIDDYKDLMAWVFRKLKSKGKAFIICPNYAAWRLEAHYHVPWYPLMPRKMASHYLTKKGKNPRYFNESIFYRTNWGVLRTLWALGFSVYDIGYTTKLDFHLSNLPELLKRWRIAAVHLVPTKDSVVLIAEKP